MDLFMVILEKCYYNYGNIYGNIGIKKIKLWNLNLGYIW